MPRLTIRMPVRGVWPWGTLALARIGSSGELSVLARKGAGEQAGGDVHDGNDPFVGHAGRANDAHRADELTIDFVRRGDHAAVVEGAEAAFAADEDLHALGPVGDVEELHEAGFCSNSLNRSRSRTMLDERSSASRRLVSGDHVGGLGFFQHFATGFDRGAHQLGHVGTQLFEFVLDATADFLESEAGEVLVEVIGGGDEFGRAVGALGEKDAVCTSPAVVTRISRMRLSDRLTNSIWRILSVSCLGETTTPAKWVSPTVTGRPR